MKTNPWKGLVRSYVEGYVTDLILDTKVFLQQGGRNTIDKTVTEVAASSHGLVSFTSGQILVVYPMSRNKVTSVYYSSEAFLCFFSCV